MFGLLVAALFAIFAHAGSNQPVAGRTSWIDLTFWAIVIASAAPLAVDWARDSIKGARERFSRRRRSDSVTETETV
jgi:hypothetical protein